MGGGVDVEVADDKKNGAGLREAGQTQQVWSAIWKNWDFI